MKQFRKILFWCHLVTGTLAGIVILIMSVTGVLLAYERQIHDWADTSAFAIAPPAEGAQRLSLEALLVKARDAQAESPGRITVPKASNAPVAVDFEKSPTLYLDPYTGAVLGHGSERVEAFFEFVESWHRWLGASGPNRTVGRAITGACNLGFLFLVASGIYLWWPRTWSAKMFRNVMWFRRGLSGKARDFNWHNVIGFWVFLPLFLVVLSGVVISYPWAGNLVYRLVGEDPPAPRGPGGPRPQSAEADAEAVQAPLDGFDWLWARAEQQTTDWQTISVQIPSDADAPVTFSIDSGSGGQPQTRAQLTLDRATGDVVRWEPFSSYSLGRQLRIFFRFAHTGEVAGLPGQTIAGIVSAGAAVLVWTGLALAWRRFRSWNGRRSGSRNDRPAAKPSDLVAEQES